MTGFIKICHHRYLYLYTLTNGNSLRLVTTVFKTMSGKISKHIQNLARDLYPGILNEP